MHHPEDGHHALAVVPELDRLARQARTKPKAALDACLELADRLASAVPHFLPVFYEQAARVFLGVDNTTYAGQLFARARTSEAQHGLAVDEDRLDAVFLEFALVGALPVKVLTGYGKELAARLAPTEAYERFRRLCVRRTAGGLAPSAQATTELRRLARAAGLSAAEAEQDYLAELLPLTATLRAAEGWWKTHRSALVALARRVPAVRGTLLEMMPPSDDGELSELWLGILAESGADAGLTGTDVPPEECCADGAAGWLERFHTARHRGWGDRRTPPALLDLVERAAGRLRADLAARPDDRAFLRIGVEDLDLLDLLLSLDLPVADPEPETSRTSGAALNLSDWARGRTPRPDRGRRRPALPRCLPALRERLPRRLLRSGRDAPARRRGRRPPDAHRVGARGRPRLGGGRTARSAQGDRPPVVAARRGPRARSGGGGGRRRRRPRRDPGAHPARRPVGGVPLAGVGEAVADLAPGRGKFDELAVFEAWPHLIVANSTRVRVIDADSTVLTHDLRVPAGQSSHRCGFHYVDGALLVFWTGYGNSPVQGYWHTAPDHVFTLDAEINYWSVRSDRPTLPLPGGGRTTGGGVLHAGDTKLPRERAVISDGTSYWVWENTGEYQGEGDWVEYDPAEDTRGRRSLPPSSPTPPAPTPPAPDWPALLVGAARPPWTARPSASPPAACSAGGSCGSPATAGAPTTPRAAPSPSRGLRHARRRPDVPRRRPAQGPDPPVAGTAAHRPGRRGHDGVRRRPERHLRHRRHAPTAADPLLRPPPARPAGSDLLRAADAETAGTLLKAAVLAERAADVPDLVAAALPGITAPELVAGVAKALRFAVAQQNALDDVAARLDPAAEPERRAPRDPTTACSPRRSTDSPAPATTAGARPRT